MIAGSEYRQRLVSLGLNPEGLLWAFDHTIKEFVLVLVTTHVDFAGPLALYELLTRAYNAMATPTLIDPFIVRLHSPKQAIVAQLCEVHGWKIDFNPADETNISCEDMLGRFHVTAGDLEFAQTWVYQLGASYLRPAERSARWKRFKRRVEALPLAA